LKPLSWYKDLSDGRNRRECLCFLVEGRRAIDQIKKVSPQSIEEILISEKVPLAIKDIHCPVRTLTDRQFDSICPSKTPQGIAAVVKIPEDSYAPDLPQKLGRRIVILEGVQDPGNVGTLVRTAAAFDFDGMVMSDTCADPFSPKAVQASAGSILSIWIRRTGRYLDIVKEIKRRKFLLVAAEVKSAKTSLESVSGNIAIMLGSEGAGLNDDLLALADEKIAIPMNQGKAESLNVAAAGAVVMYTFSR
jgi:RNA methyltransferase, TrmH family